MTHYCQKATISLILLLFSCSVFSQTPAQRAKITREYKTTQLTKLKDRLTLERQKAKLEAEALAVQNGWPIRYTFDNGEGVAELVRIGPNGNPVYFKTFNVDAAVSTRTDHVNSGGSLNLNLDGQGMTAYVWDGGAVRVSHQEFDGPGGNNRATQNDGATSLSNHATHVTGTIVAAGTSAAAKGMASQAQALTHDWNSDLAEMATEAGNGMLVSNHSYGFAWRNQFGQVQLPAWWGGAYLESSRDADEVMYNAPFYLMVSSAGNDGDDNTANSNPLGGNSNFDKLTGYSTSKNNLVVAATEDVSVNADGTVNGSIAITNFSSEGPTDDFRIKPDIAGNGRGLVSASSSGNASYATLSGTSMSGPNVAGSALLLQQHYNNVNGTFMRASTLKGLILHTADDAGINGPDAIFGWGLMNTKAAAEAISANGNSTLIEEVSLTNGNSYQITVSAAGGPLMASISWTDPVGTVNTGTANLSTPVLVNDLDIRVTQGGNTSLPWAMTGVNSNARQDNRVDPYERVDISNGSGSYTITVTHKGSLPSAQTFSLIVTGISGCDLAAPGNLSASSIGDNSFNLSWNSVAGANGYTVNIGGNATTVSGTSFSATGLTAGTSYNVSVSANCSSGGSGAASSINVTTTGSTPINCNGTVSSFPYAESFESSAGWTQLGGDDGDWVRDQNGTPSSGTGPSSGADGSWYMFLEASTNGSPGQIGNNATAILESPCFDLSGATTATFSFQNHMNGTAVGSLTLQASTDDQTWTDIWSQSGSQGDQWNAEDVSLDAYAGGTVKLRMVGTTGNGWSSDIAIDDLALDASSSTADTDPPTVPTGLASSNITETAFDISWSASSDNVGVTGYTVYLDGSSLGTVTGTGASITGLTASTSYLVTVSAFDAAGNASAQSSALSVTTASPPGGGSTVISANFFETGWEDWNDGGSDASRINNPSNAYEGSYSLRIRDNTNSSVITTDPFNLAGYSSIEVEFFFRPVGMENGEDFWFQYNDGSGFETVATWVVDNVNISNNTFYTTTVTLSSADFSFVNGGTFRFRNDASVNNDRVYIDAVTITGISGSSNSTGMTYAPMVGMSTFV
ncbi:MAG: S8 family serine peptidase, partial [Bacteroidota bacterium]